MIREMAVLLLALMPLVAVKAAPQGACAGSPGDAVLSLPSPLSDWASVVCTPYGHVISGRDGWIWTPPGAYAPVFVPSQMVRSKPEPIGNKAYFTKIAFVEAPLSAKETKDALAAINEGMSAEPASKAYRLSATGYLGRSLVLYFFQFGTSTWGIWCDERGSQCSSSSAFMVLDMRKGA